MAGENTIKLSILIPTVPRRKAHLERLLATLEPQLTDEVELLVLLDNRKRKIGAKRNSMLSIANGSYVVFVDDDDDISSEYVSVLLQGIESKEDVILFDCEVRIDHKEPEGVVFSTKHKNSFVGGIHYRKPNHLMCYKREIATMVKYPDTQMGEDFEYSEEIVKHIKKEHHTNRTLYTYNMVRSNSECY